MALSRRPKGDVTLISFTQNIAYSSAETVNTPLAITIMFFGIYWKLQDD